MNDKAPASTRELLEFATEIGWEAGRLIMSHFQVGVGVSTKPDRTPVTEADIAGERLLRKRIEAKFPRHRILGEEDGESGSDPAHRWILDPIDGTTSFIHGVAAVRDADRPRDQRRGRGRASATSPDSARWSPAPAARGPSGTAARRTSPT